MSDEQQQEKRTRGEPVPVSRDRGTPPPADKQFRAKPSWGEGGSYALAPRRGRGLPGAGVTEEGRVEEEVGVPSRREALFPRRSRSPESSLPLPNVRREPERVEREASPSALPGRSGGGLPAATRSSSVSAPRVERVSEPSVPSSFVESGDWGEEETAAEAALEQGRKY